MADKIVWYIPRILCHPGLIAIKCKVFSAFDGSYILDEPNTSGISSEYVFKDIYSAYEILKYHILRLPAPAKLGDSTLDKWRDFEERNLKIIFQRQHQLIYPGYIRTKKTKNDWFTIVNGERVSL